MIMIFFIRADTVIVVFLGNDLFTLCSNSSRSLPAGLNQIFLFSSASCLAVLCPSL